jgi:uncharacterized protein (TIGR02266 family)
MSPSPSAHPSQSQVPIRDSRRAHQRADIEIDISLESETNFYMGLTENLSEGGLFIATHAVRPIGATVEVSFSLPDCEGRIRAKGTVRWVRLFGDASDTSPGMGLRFDEISAEGQAEVRKFIEKRPPLFHDAD